MNSTASMREPAYGYAGVAPGVPFPLRLRESWRDVINPELIAIALVYLAWSYFALASSIWVRFFLLSYLILRMKPDVIIPLALTCIQVRLLLLPSSLPRGIDDPLADVYASLTGYEAYTFALPLVFFIARSFFAYWEKGAAISAGRFPRKLFVLWWCGLPFIIAGALMALSYGRGWTGGLRLYCVIGTCFFGMLMPTMSVGGLRRLVTAFAILGLILFSIASVTVVNSRLLFVLAPLCTAYGYFAIRGFERGAQPLLGAALLGTSGYYCFGLGTFTQQSIWLVALLCAIAARPFAVGKSRSAKPFIVACWAATIACCLVFAYAVTMQIAEKLEIPKGVLGRVHWKMIADRGPIWFGALQLLQEEPHVVAVPNRPYVVVSRGVNQKWVVHTHNLELDCLREFGMAAGPIAIFVVLCFTAMMVSRFSHFGTTPAAILTIALFSGVVVGGLTLPYMITDRQAEPLLVAAGAAYTAMSRKQRRSFATTGRPAAAVQQS